MHIYAQYINEEVAFDNGFIERDSLKAQITESKFSPYVKL